MTIGFSTPRSSSTIRISSTIRAPLGDHDAINGNSMDFGGLFIDPLNTGRTALRVLRQPAQRAVRRGRRRRIRRELLA